jgi:fused signal recognition particle receptor
VGITGLILTKLDGTARAGVIFAIANKLKNHEGGVIPVFYIGIGEGVDDLKPFEVEPFVDALLPDETESA